MITLKKRELILILPDQLSIDISSLKFANKSTCCVFFAETNDFFLNCGHHKKKLIFLLSAMRHFNEQLVGSGWETNYLEIDHARNSGKLKLELGKVIRQYQIGRVTVTEPSDWTLRVLLRKCQELYNCEFNLLPDDRFLCSTDEFDAWAEDRKQIRLEFFYRVMRRKTNLLMEGDKPVGGRWNFDKENRKRLPSTTVIPEQKTFIPDNITEKVISTVKKSFPNNFGDAEPFGLAVTKGQAEIVLETFIQSALPNFGRYQDAMLLNEPFLFHSFLSLYLNVGFLNPRYICERVEKEFNDGKVPLNAAEGFIRQIIGWREFMRAIYLREMPSYRTLNFLEADLPLPNFYWSGQTDMSCLRDTIRQTSRESYSHHIQRLMVSGNFALISGTKPLEVHNWFLSVYADAHEWVELPNTLGMSQFGDGGLVASKPYASGGNYINKMSNYCKSCKYDVNDKSGPNSCPFNSLYWDFLARNQAKLAGNPRLNLAYKSWERIGKTAQHTFRKRAADLLGSMNDL